MESYPARKTGIALTNRPILTDYDRIARADFPSDQGAYQFVSFILCTSYLDCDDSNVYTNNICTTNSTNGECVHANIAGCYQTISDCDVDDNQNDNKVFEENMFTKQL